MNKVELVENKVTQLPTKVTDENGNANNSAKSSSHLKQPKFKSKLSKPRAIVKPLGREDLSGTDSPTGSPPTQGGGGIPRPSKLPSAITKPSKSQPSKKQDTSPKPRKSKLKSKNSKPKKGVNVTFLLDEDDDDSETGVQDESFDYEIPEVTTPSRVDPVSALTLAYDLESSGSDSENKAKKQQCNTPPKKDNNQCDTTYVKVSSTATGLGPRGDKLNLTFDITDNKTDSVPQEPGSLTSPIPDLLTNHVPAEPSEAAGEAMSESEAEDELEFLGQSQASQASSLGILSNSQLANNSLLSGSLKIAIQRQTSKDSIEITDKDLDSEIAGVATPEVQSEVDMSSSTISCDSIQQPSLEPDLVPIKEGDLTFNPEPGKTSTPSTPAKGVSADPKMADENNSSEVDKPQEPILGMTFNVKDNTTDLDGTAVKDTNTTYTVETSEGNSSNNSSSTNSQVDESDGRCTTNKSSSMVCAPLTDPEEYPGSMRSSVDIDDENDNRADISVSIELAKTAVSQYADLVKSAEIERMNKETREVEKQAKKARLAELKAKRSETEKMDIDEDGDDNLLVELRAGYEQKQRPLSTISTASIDTGIGMDSSVTSIDSEWNKLERPLSMVSSTSTDAGENYNTVTVWESTRCCCGT